MSDGLLQSLSSRGSVSRRNLLARASRRLAVLVGGGFVSIGLEDVLARKASTEGALGGRHGQNKRGRHHKHHHKHRKHKAPGGGAGCRNTSQCKQGEECCNGNCVDLQTNPNHCGACGKKCSSGFCRGAKCIDCTVCSTCTNRTIQQAITNSSPNATIWICAGTYNEHVLVDKAGLELNGLVAGSDKVVISGGGQPSPDPVLNVRANNVRVRDLTVTGAKASAETGGGVVTNGLALLLQRVTITGNDAGNFSGGGLSNSAWVTLDSCKVTGNTAAVGGGLGNDFNSAIMTLTNTIVENNTATESGGGINNQGTLTLDAKSFVKANESKGGAGSGGGIFNKGKLTVTGQSVASAVKDNTPDQCVNNSGGTGC